MLTIELTPNSAVHNLQQSNALATENPVDANRQNDTVSTLPLTDEHLINYVNSSSLTNIPVHQSPAQFSLHLLYRTICTV